MSGLLTPLEKSINGNGDNMQNKAAGYGSKNCSLTGLMSDSKIEAKDFKSIVWDWAIKLKVEPKEIHLRPMKTKWASLSGSGRLTFNSELLEKHRKLIDYVILHLDSDIKELRTINGISNHTAWFLNLLKDIAILYLEKGLHNKDLLSSPQVVYDYLKASLKGAVDEEFKTLFLDSRNQLIAVETLKTGTVNRSVVYPRKIVERALYNHAAGVIIAHNHPAGTLQPSQDDITITNAIKTALETVDIVLLDHIIIGGNSYFSFKANGL